MHLQLPYVSASILTRPLPEAAWKHMLFFVQNLVYKYENGKECRKVIEHLALTVVPSIPQSHLIIQLQGVFYHCLS